MNRVQTRRTAWLFLLVLSGFTIHGQKSSNKPTPGQERKTEKTRVGQRQPKEENADLLLAKRFAQMRLETVGEHAKLLDDSIIKVKILGKVADAMWASDETRARQLFISAFKTIESIKLDAKQDQRVAVAERRGGHFGPLFHLRNFILQLVARNDFKLAENLRKSVEDAESNDDRNNPLKRDEQDHIYLNIAVALAETQPEQSAQLIRGFFRNGIDSSVVSALRRIRGANSLLADQLFKEAIASASLHQMLPGELGSLAIYVLPNEEDLFYGNDPLNDATRVPVIRRFLDYVYAGSSSLMRANAVSPTVGNRIDTEQAESAYHTLKDLLPMFERLQPERSAFVREQMGALLSFMTPQGATTATATSRETVEDLLRKAESAIGERRRTTGFMRASGAALEEGDIEKALEIAERVDDLRERKIQTSLVLYQTAMRRLREGKIEQAYMYGRRIEFLPQRVAILHRLAQRLWRDKEPDRARTTLEELWNWLEKADNTPQRAEAMLKITATMAQHDKERGFELLRSTAKAVNSTDFSFKGFDRNVVSVEVHIAPDMLDLDSSFISLAHSDPERAMSIAQSLTKPELSLLAQAIVCQQVLAPR